MHESISRQEIKSERKVKTKLPLNKTLRPPLKVKFLDIFFRIFFAFFKRKKNNRVNRKPPHIGGAREQYKNQTKLTSYRRVRRDNS